MTLSRCRFEDHFASMFEIVGLVGSNLAQLNKCQSEWSKHGLSERHHVQCKCRDFQPRSQMIIGVTCIFTMLNCHLMAISSDSNYHSPVMGLTSTSTMTTLKSLHRSGSVLLSPQKRRRISGQGNSSQAKTPPSSKQVWEWILTSAGVIKCYVRDAMAMPQDEEGWSFPVANVFSIMNPLIRLRFLLVGQYSLPEGRNCRYCGRYTGI